MAVMMGKLYAALRDADVPEDKATAAAEEAASFENSAAALRADSASLKNEFTSLRGRVDLLTWMIGFNIAMTVAIVGKVFLAR